MQTLNATTQTSRRKSKVSTDRPALSVDTTTTQAKPCTALCGSLSDLHLDQLRQIGLSKFATSAAATLHVAATAFRGQLDVFSKQLPDGRYIECHTPPGVHRLEYLGDRLGHEALGDLGTESERHALQLGRAQLELQV